MGSWRVRTRARAPGDSTLEPRIEPVVVGNATNAWSPKEMKKKKFLFLMLMALPPPPLHLLQDNSGPR
jgi:hypothetical protein